MPRLTVKERLSNLRKAAIFMISIGPEAAAQIYKHLSEQDIEKLSGEIARLENVAASELSNVNDEFHNMILAQQYISAGGLNYAQDILVTALGEKKAMEIIKRVQMTLEVKGFSVLEDVDVTQLLAFLQKEHPQTIALVLSQLTPIQAANVLAELSPNIQIDVMHRIARMERVTPETLNAVEKVLESHIDFTQATSKFGGVKPAAEILNMVGQRFEKNILSGISKEDAELAGEIKNLMFVFEDMIKLDDRSIQKVLKEVDNKELAMALKACSNELKDKILRNMSKRASEMIQEEIEYMGPVRLREVETVQQHVVDIIRRLEEEGEIYVSAGSEEDTLV
ncbi:MAG TPA: flagellar motor switch protein FliG [Bacteroidetes bacterium]|nr:flagellar motor switch protein FliG [Bacteroidota bacterium]